MMKFVLEIVPHRIKILAQHKEVPKGLKREALPRTDEGIYPAPSNGWKKIKLVLRKR